MGQMNKRSCHNLIIGKIDIKIGYFFALKSYHRIRLSTNIYLVRLRTVHFVDYQNYFLFHRSPIHPFAHSGHSTPFRRFKARLLIDQIQCIFSFPPFFWLIIFQLNFIELIFDIQFMKFQFV